MRPAVWRRIHRDPDVLKIRDELVALGDAKLNKDPSSALQVKTHLAEGKNRFRPLEMEHQIRISENPWKYNIGANTSFTTSYGNRILSEQIRKTGLWVGGDKVEEFVVRVGLVDQKSIGLPGSTK